MNQLVELHKYIGYFASTHISGRMGYKGRNGIKSSLQMFVRKSILLSNFNFIFLISFRDTLKMSGFQ